MAEQTANKGRENIKGTGLVVGFSLVFLFLVGTALSSFFNVQRVLEANERARHSDEVLNSTELASGELNATESAGRGYIVTGFPSYRKAFESDLAITYKDIDDLERDTIDNDAQQVRIRNLRNLVREKAAAMEEGMLRRDTEGLQAIAQESQPGKGQILMDQIQMVLGSIRQEEVRLRTERDARVDRNVNSAEYTFWASSILGILLLCGVTFITSRYLRSQIDLRQLEAQKASDLEDLVNIRTAELQEANRDLESFSYSVSHDLRSPLRAIRGFSAFLRDDLDAKLTDDERAYFERITRGVETMSKLVDSLLSLSRVSRSDFKAESVDLSQLAREATQDVSDRPSVIMSAVAIEEGMTARGDAAMLRILLDNVLGNAFKFTSKVQNPQITVGSTELKGEQVFYVRDNGAGFDPEAASKIFEPFQRLHAESEFPGSGVGLATCYKIVRRHGGRIWAESAIGVGTTIYFTLSPPTSQATGEESSQSSANGASLK